MDEMDSNRPQVKPQNAVVYPRQALFVYLWIASIPMVILMSLIQIQTGSGSRDKMEHFLGYAALGILPLLGFSRLPVAIAGCLSMILLGVVLEFLQKLTPWRSFEPLDIAANTAGVLAGLLAGWVLRCLVVSRRRRKAQP